jgi:hypothetical protein
MKRLLFGFIVGLLLGNVARVRAQEQAPEVHPQRDLTVKELIELMADFDIKHVDQQPFFPPAFGVTHFVTNPPSIWIFNGQTFPSKESTVIHEALHVRCERHNVKCSDDWVSTEEVRQYLKIFGDFAQ